MFEEKYIINITPEVLKTDLIQEEYTSDNKTFLFQIYSGFSQILSGGTNGDSLLTGLTIPIMFTQSINDLGVYSEFDGNILQKDVTTNFLFSGNPLNPYEITAYNTSGDINISFLTYSNFEINWGDGTPTQQMTNQQLTHTYPNISSGYTISFKSSNSWGSVAVNKKIQIPTTGVTVTNLEGNITLNQNGGNWSGIPQSYDFIFTGDSENNVLPQISSNYTQVPFSVSGYTISKLNTLRGYGTNPYNIGYQIFKNGQVHGQIDDITPTYTAYTIGDIHFYDLINGQTLYIGNSSGLTIDNIIATGITKNETFLDFVMDPEIESDVYVERGKYSGFEPLQRLGEVDNIGDLTSYGYNYFKINVV